MIDKLPSLQNNNNRFNSAKPPKSASSYSKNSSGSRCGSRSSSSRSDSSRFKNANSRLIKSSMLAKSADDEKVFK